MIDPFTMAIGGSAISLIGGLLNAGGQKQKAEADARMYQYRAQIARQNAAIARQNSIFALEAGETNARRSGTATGFTIARQKVAQSASGFDVNSGTAVAVRESTRDIGREDQTTIRTEFGRKALGERNKATMLDMDAAMGDTAAASARKAGEFNIASTLLGTAGSVASRWMQGSQAFGGASSGITTYDENFKPTAFMPT